MREPVGRVVITPSPRSEPSSCATCSRSEGVTRQHEASPPRLSPLSPSLSPSPSISPSLPPSLSSSLPPCAFYSSLCLSPPSTAPSKGSHRPHPPPRLRSARSPRTPRPALTAGAVLPFAERPSRPPTLRGCEVRARLDSAPLSGPSGQVRDVEEQATTPGGTDRGGSHVRRQSKLEQRTQHTGSTHEHIAACARPLTATAPKSCRPYAPVVLAMSACDSADVSLRPSTARLADRSSAPIRRPIHAHTNLMLPPSKSTRAAGLSSADRHYVSSPRSNVDGERSRKTKHDSLSVTVVGSKTIAEPADDSSANARHVPPAQGPAVSDSTSAVDSCSRRSGRLRWAAPALAASIRQLGDEYVPIADSLERAGVTGEQAGTLDASSLINMGVRELRIVRGLTAHLKHLLAHEAQEEATGPQMAANHVGRPSPSPDCRAHNVSESTTAESPDTGCIIDNEICTRNGVGATDESIDSGRPLEDYATRGMNGSRISSTVPIIVSMPAVTMRQDVLESAGNTVPLPTVVSPGGGKMDACDGRYVAVQAGIVPGSVYKPSPHLPDGHGSMAATAGAPLRAQARPPVSRLRMDIALLSWLASSTTKRVRAHSRGGLSGLKSLLARATAEVEAASDLTYMLWSVRSSIAAASVGANPSDASTRGISCGDAATTKVPSEAQVMALVSRLRSHYALLDRRAEKLAESRATPPPLLCTDGLAARVVFHTYSKRRGSAPAFEAVAGRPRRCVAMLRAPGVLMLEEAIADAEGQDLAEGWESSVLGSMVLAPNPPDCGRRGNFNASANKPVSPQSICLPLHGCYARLDPVGFNEPPVLAVHIGGATLLADPVAFAFSMAGQAVPGAAVVAAPCISCDVSTRAVTADMALPVSPTRTAFRPMPNPEPSFCVSTAPAAAGEAVKLQGTVFRPQSPTRSARREVMSKPRLWSHDLSRASQSPRHRDEHGTSGDCARQISHMRGHALEAGGIRLPRGTTSVDDPHMELDGKMTPAHKTSSNEDGPSTAAARVWAPLSFEALATISFDTGERDLEEERREAALWLASCCVIARSLAASILHESRLVVAWLDYLRAVDASSKRHAIAARAATRCEAQRANVGQRRGAGATMAGPSTMPLMPSAVLANLVLRPPAPPPTPDELVSIAEAIVAAEMPLPAPDFLAGGTRKTSHVQDGLKSCISAHVSATFGTAPPAVKSTWGGGSQVPIPRLRARRPKLSNAAARRKAIVDLQNRAANRTAVPRTAAAQAEASSGRVEGTADVGSTSFEHAEVAGDDDAYGEDEDIRALFESSTDDEEDYSVVGRHADGPGTLATEVAAQQAVFDHSTSRDAMQERVSFAPSDATEVMPSHSQIPSSPSTGVIASISRPVTPSSPNPSTVQSTQEMSPAVPAPPYFEPARVTVRSLADDSIKLQAELQSVVASIWQSDAALCGAHEVEASQRASEFAASALTAVRGGLFKSVDVVRETSDSVFLRVEISRGFLLSDRWPPLKLLGALPGVSPAAAAVCASRAVDSDALRAGCGLRLFLVSSQVELIATSPAEASAWVDGVNWLPFGSKNLALSANVAIAHPALARQRTDGGDPFAGDTAVSLGPSGDPAEDEMRTAFRVFDKDGSGTVSREELRAILRAVGERRSEAELEAMLAAADVDGDGTIDYSEFRKLMKGS